MKDSGDFYKPIPETWRWNYLNADGDLLGFVERYQKQDGKKEYTPYFKYCKSKGFLPGYAPGLRSLFGLHTIGPVVKESLVFVVEGEKCATAIISLGLSCVTSPGGAGSASKADWAPLSGTDRVIILPDNDDPGRMYGREVCERLRLLKKPPKVHAFPLPDLPVKGDFIDWVYYQFQQLENLSHSEKNDWNGYDPIPEEKREQIRNRLMSLVQNYDHNIQELHCQDALNDVSTADWSEPIPICEELWPRWPEGLFPPAIENYIKQLANFTETPIEMAGMLALSVIATTIHDKYVIEPKPGYQEPLCIWICVAMAPANRKSEVIKKLTAPLNRFEACKEKEWTPIIQRRRCELKVRQESVQSLVKKLASEQDENERESLRNKIEFEESNLPTIPVLPRILAGDVTPEKLAVLMGDQRGCMSIIYDEPSIFSIITGRYSKGVPNLEIFLQGHSGTKVCVDRQNKDPVLIPEAVLTMGVTVQPQVLKDLAEKDGLRERGLLARFLFSMPKTMLGSRSGDKLPIEKDVSDEYERVINAILSRISEDGTSEDSKRSILRFSSKAKEKYLDLFKTIEQQLSEEGLFGHVQDWGGKLLGALVRVSGLIHVIKYADDDPNSREVDFPDKIDDFMEFLVGNALNVFSYMSIDIDKEGAKCVLNWIKRKKKEEFTARDCYRDLRQRFPTRSDLDKPLGILIEHGYIKGTNSHSEIKPVGRPKEEYEVNPLIFA